MIDCVGVVGGDGGDHCVALGGRRPIGVAGVVERIAHRHRRAGPRHAAALGLVDVVALPHGGHETGGLPIEFGGIVGEVEHVRKEVLRSGVLVEPACEIRNGGGEVVVCDDGA